MEQLLDLWADFYNLVSSDRGFAFFLGFLLAYVIKAIKV